MLLPDFVELKGGILQYAEKFTKQLNKNILPDIDY